MKCIWKVTGLVSQTIYFKSKKKNNLHSFIFKVITLKSDAFFHPSVILLCTAKRMPLEFPSALSLRPSWWSPHHQNGSPWYPPSAWGKEKCLMVQGQENREAIPAEWCPSCPRTARCSEHWEQVPRLVEAAKSCPATILVSSRTLCGANIAGSLCRLADWLILKQELTVDIASHFE